MENWSRLRLGVVCFSLSGSAVGLEALAGPVGSRGPSPREKCGEGVVPVPVRCRVSPPCVAGECRQLQLIKVDGFWKTGSKTNNIIKTCNGFLMTKVQPNLKL